MVWAYSNQVCIKQNRNQNSILLYVLAVFPVYGTGKFANLFELPRYDIRKGRICECFPLSASKNNISYYVIPVTRCCYLPNVGHKPTTSSAFHQG